MDLYHTEQRGPLPGTEDSARPLERQVSFLLNLLCNFHFYSGKAKTLVYHFVEKEKDGKHIQYSDDEEKLIGIILSHW